MRYHGIMGMAAAGERLAKVYVRTGSDFDLGRTETDWANCG